MLDKVSGFSKTQVNIQFLFLASSVLKVKNILESKNKPTKIVYYQKTMRNRNKKFLKFIAIKLEIDFFYYT
jgi:hypothetical protein